MIFFVIIREGLRKCGLESQRSGSMKRYNNRVAGKVMRTKEELETMCTMIIFQSSVKHTSVNGLQWEYSSFAPVTPCCMLGNIITEADRGKITKQFIMESLPTPNHCIRGAGIAFILSEFSRDEIFLLHGRYKMKKRRLKRRKTVDAARSLTKGPVSRYQGLQMSNLSELRSDLLPPRWMFTEEKATMAFLAFQNILELIEDQIIERNSELVQNGKAPYEVLLPSRIPCGIGI